jgi:NAD(P)-dependent dehydrogenase (short-subunit alcohol dehydrogenase family)
LNKPLKKYALITGANSGLGYASALVLSNRGFIVFACDIKLDKLQVTKNIIPLEMDVTCEQSVIITIDKIKTITNQLDVVGNFAGIIKLGSFIENDVAISEQMFDIGFHGLIRVNKYTFELVKNGSGRYINLSSEYGRLKPPPFHGYYTALKHAIEIYNDSLRRELAPLGIRVIKMRPGAFRTNMIEDAKKEYVRIVGNTNLYKNTLNKMNELMKEELSKTKNPDIFVKQFIKAALSNKPKHTYSVKRSFKMRLLSILPDFIVDKIYLMFFK